MEASFVDLRKKSAEIIKALKRKERVTVLYRGKPAAVMQPIGHQDASNPMTSAAEHEAFGLWADRQDSGNVAHELRAIRRRRYDDL